MYLIKQVRWDKDMAKELRVNIEMTQLMAGLKEPIMKKTEKPIDYLEESWVLTVRKRLSIESISVDRGYMENGKAKRELYLNNGCNGEDTRGQQSSTESS